MAVATAPTSAEYKQVTVLFTDGVTALFGAPVALEDHAFRACLAALAIQEEANRPAAEVQRRDGVALRLRVGLNSGRVIAGEIGSGSLGYRAIGEQVGFAQRMESRGALGRGRGIGGGCGDDVSAGSVRVVWRPLRPRQ